MAIALSSGHFPGWDGRIYFRQLREDRLWDTRLDMGTEILYIGIQSEITLASLEVNTSTQSMVLLPWTGWKFILPD